MTPTCKAVTTLSELKQLSTSVLLRVADSCFQFRKLKILPFQRRVFQKDQCHLNSSTNSKTGSWHALKHLPADAQTAAERCKQDCLDWTKSRQTPGVQNKNSLHLQDISEYLTSCVFLSRPILCDRQTNRRTGLLTCPRVLTVKCGLKNHVLSLTKTFKVCVCMRVPVCVSTLMWAHVCMGLSKLLVVTDIPYKVMLVAHCYRELHPCECNNWEESESIPSSAACVPEQCTSTHVIKGGQNTAGQTWNQRNNCLLPEGIL